MIKHFSKYGVNKRKLIEEIVGGELVKKVNQV